MRLIDGDALIERIKYCIDQGMGASRAYMFMHMIDDAPTIEPKRGENLNNQYMDCDQFICSECGIELRDWTRVEVDEYDGEEYHYEYVFRFCPNCGCRMKGADDES